MRHLATGPGAGTRAVAAAAELTARAIASGDPGAISRAVVAWECVLSDHPEQVDLYAASGMSVMLFARYECNGDVADLDDAVDVGTWALDTFPLSDPNAPGHLSNLANTLRVRFEQAGRRADLDEAVDLARKAVELAGSGSPEQGAYLTSLANTLRTRFEHFGNRSDLDAAVGFGRDAIQADGSGHPFQGMRLSNQCFSLRLRFLRFGDPADLDEAVRLGREGVRVTPLGHPNQRMYLHNLGLALRVRFKSAGVRADLDEAVDAGRQAVRVTPAHDVYLAPYQSGLGNALLARFERFGDPADLEAAVGAHREAHRATPLPHPDHGLFANGLANTLGERFHHAANAADLDEAISLGREALRGIPADHPVRALLQSNLGRRLVTRFALDARYADDLVEAVDRCQAAVRSAPADHPGRTAFLLNLGQALEHRFHHTASEDDRRRAVSAYTSAWEGELGSPSERLAAAWQAAQLLVRSQSEQARAAALLDAAVLLLPKLAPRQQDRTDQQHALSDVGGLAAEAAALALAHTPGNEADRALRALQLLETGRAVMLSQRMDARSDLADLHRQHPALAERFVAQRRRLDDPADTSAVGNDATRQTLDRHQSAAAFERTLEEIRELDGFDSFGRPPTTDDLLTQAEHGPVVVFNTAAHRSDALLVTGSGVSAVPLPALDRATIGEHVIAFHRALQIVETGERREQRKAQATLSHTLKWLWDAAVDPVLTALGHGPRTAPEDPWPRVWWAPGGLLGLLPVHAAGHHHTEDADTRQGDTALDRVVSSYTPTVRVLRHTRQRATPTLHGTRALVVAMPTTPGLGDDHGQLFHVPAETAKVQQHLPHHVLLREPDPGTVATTLLPTKANVLAQLPTCAIAHFACHGASHPTDPSSSRLLLHDHARDPLTVGSLGPIDLRNAQLAYLSACHTAAIDAADLLDEAIHLTSAFQLAGFPHVVGTLWAIDDATAVDVADAFYRHIRADTGALDTGRAALALHTAVRALRDRLPRTPSLWAAYLHAGA
ncbi:CHAT domain-containing protein [Streptomyces sp. NPDC096136]|uniref:CHAT domain-containing protein n=1 Tax=Streptomyces sp. NPDC096136 TaxID=3366076 RepID=UPI0037FBB481